ncbi:MAG: RNA-binding S4 domain-containing protein [Lutibacter sp.]|jgi:ribosome-associated heat shock protein Hsp15|nr:RNA-binding S4 domain-containing protein [Lutibacter sp.]
MRIDKYLWCVRYYKTRNNATEACRKGHIKMNGDSIKASKTVFNHEKITIRKDQINYLLEVLDIPASRVGAKLVDLYRKDITPVEEFEKLDLLKYSKDYYRKKGEGRPTKKNRRDINDYQEDEN